MSRSSAASLFQFPELIVLEASAGSGKTYQLAARYTQLLFLLTSRPQADRDRHAMRQILALTFANKAASEMRSRIIDLIKKAALGTLAEHERRDVLDPVGLSIGEARGYATALMATLIREFNFFQVQTIDSFMRTVLAGCAFKIDRSARFRIRHDAKDHLSRAVDNLIDNARRDKTTRDLLVRFLDQYLFIEARTAWLPKKDIQRSMVALYRVSNTYGADFAFYPLKAEAIPRQKKNILAWSRELAGLCQNAGITVDRNFLGFLEKYPVGFPTDKLSLKFKSEALPCNKSKIAFPGRSEQLWEDIRQEIDALCRNEAYGIHNIHIELFGEVLREFRQVTRREDVVFVEELNKTARSLLVDVDFLPELCYRLATRFSHYLIDEFQDTNPLQWQNLHLMVEDALSGPGSFFYVGDKKQAIYSFRGGDARLFDVAQAEFNISPQLSRLEKNFRSHAEIVNFNNLIFSQDNLQRFLVQLSASLAEKSDHVVELGADRQQRILDVFSGSAQAVVAGHEGGYVQIRRISGQRMADREQVVQTDLMALLQELGKRYSWRDVAILTRKNDQSASVAAWLLEAGIPVDTDKTTRVQDNPLIQELMAFLVFLASPINDQAFARFLGGEIFCQVSGLSREDLQAFLFTHRRKRGAENEYLYKIFAVQYSKAWTELLEPFYKKVGFYPLYELAVSLVSQLQVLSNFAGDRAFVMHWLEIIRNAEEEFTDLDAFLNYFEELAEEHMYVPILGQEAVKVLTVHKAKGLEFPVVILPFFEMRVTVGGRDGQEKSYIVDRDDPDGLRLKRLSQKAALFSKTLAEDYDQEYVKALGNDLNAMYVALTRARDEMYVFIPDRSANGANQASDLIPQEAVNFGRPGSAAAVQAKVLSSLTTLPPPEYRSWLTRLDDEFGESLSLDRLEAAVRGDIIHHVLAAVGDLRGLDKKSVIDQAVRAASVEFPLAGDLGVYGELVSRFVDDPAVREFFYPGPAVAVRTEAEIINAYGDSRRVDRLLIEPTRITVIDFKTAVEKEAEHGQQVGDYAALLREVYPGRLVRGVVVYVDPIRIVEAG